MTQPQPNLPRVGLKHGHSELGLTYRSNTDRMRAALAEESDQRVNVILKLTSRLISAARRLDAEDIELTQQMIDSLNMREQVTAVIDTFQPVDGDTT